MNNNRPPSISGNLEAIEQCLSLCQLLDDNSYTLKALPFVQSSIGEHLRHIVDMYRALIAQPDIGVVDYDCRRRGAPIETCLQTGIEELNQIKNWLINLKDEELNHAITILSEATLSCKNVCEMPSSLARELLFVSSHTIHHLAIVKIITLHANINASDQLGYAPATATYLRGEA